MIYDRKLSCQKLDLPRAVRYRPGGRKNLIKWMRPVPWAGPSFGDRVNWDVYPDPGIDLQQYQMIPLLLQPLIENAITHGLEQRKHNGHISLIIEAQQDKLLLSVSDNGAGMSPAQLQAVRASLATKLTAQSQHIGLSNIHHRIQLHYGPAYGLRIESSPGSGTIVSIVLPRYPGPAPVSGPMSGRGLIPGDKTTAPASIPTEENEDKT